MSREPLSVVVTTFNNAATLARCLASVAFAEERVVLDSGSTDGTEAIARAHGAHWFVEPFKGYGPQKQSAVAKATHRWVLLLDADEAVPTDCRAAIERALEQPAVAGFRIPRREQAFWRLAHRGVDHARMLRLFERDRVRFSGDAVHAAPEVDGPKGRIEAPFIHYGEPDIRTKVDKINAYSSGMVADKSAQGYAFVRTRMLLQPPLQFLRSYFLRRKFLSGWAGFIGSVTEAYYVFLKYAKLYESRQPRRDE
jgi:glycosyltransferase involved in cell wall biosynthesis